MSHGRTLGFARFFFVKHTKTEKIIPHENKNINRPKIYTKCLLNIPNDHNNTNIIHSKALQNMPKLEFLV
jgi:hypothetical protein